MFITNVYINTGAQLVQVVIPSMDVSISFLNRFRRETSDTLDPPSRYELNE